MSSGHVVGMKGVTQALGERSKQRREQTVRGQEWRREQGRTAQEHFASRVEVPLARHLHCWALPHLPTFGTTCPEFDDSCGQLQEVRAA
jgi:hypothetical protein